MDKTISAPIKVIGFGGCGCNTISYLANLHYSNLELVAANTDFFNLSHCKASKKIQLGESACGGLGTGGDIELGLRAAEESYKELINEIKNASLLVLTAGMGGGTGSGAIEIAARIARSLDVPNISFVSLPFSFESDLRKTNTYNATVALQKFTDTLITIPNDKLLSLFGADAELSRAFQLANIPINNFLIGLLDLIDYSGLMHIDLSYIINALQTRQGIAIITGQGNGVNRLPDAVESTFDIQIVDSAQLSAANHVVLKMTGDLTVDEAYSMVDLIKERFPSQPSITPIIASKAMGQRITLSLLLTGIGATAIPYPYSWSKNHVSETNLIYPKNESIAVNQKPLENEFQDILEIPAFIRKEKNRRKVISN